MPPHDIEWLDAARADVRDLDRATAMRLFEGILHFARNGSGNVNALHGDMAGAFRLRVGDYRVLFTLEQTSCTSSASAIALRLIVEQLGGLRPSALLSRTLSQRPQCPNWEEEVNGNWVTHQLKEGKTPA